MENRKKSIEELQTELALESEALATLQIIYAEKVKQVRTNTSLPPDIQARFLSEWETFYQQRVAAIFKKTYYHQATHSERTSHPEAIYQAPAPQVAKPIAVIQPPSPPAVNSPVNTPINLPVNAPTPPGNIAASIPVMPPAMPPSAQISQAPPILQQVLQPPAPPPPPSAINAVKAPVTPSVTSPTASASSFSSPPPPSFAASQAASTPSMPSPIDSSNLSDNSMLLTETPNSSDDILGVNTDSWMNAAESLTYEPYSDSDQISSGLMENEKLQNTDDELTYIDENDSIDGYAATSGLKGLTEFMDFDLKRKKN